MFKLFVSIMIVCLTFFSVQLPADSNNDLVMNIISETNSSVELSFHLEGADFEDFLLNGETYQNIVISGVFLPADPGKPNLPGFSRSVAIPQGADAYIEILEVEYEVFEHIVPSPAPVIPNENDDSPLYYPKDLVIYNGTSLYPNEILIISDPWKIRGVDVVTFSLIPFQWDPVTENIKVYTKVKFRIIFQGGNGHFGEDRLRSRNWDRIIKSSVINGNSLPDINYSKRLLNANSEGRDNAEFVIIVPDDSSFISWADSIKRYRTEEGIITEVFTLTDIGGTSASQIESWIDNAYNTWSIPPEAVLLLSDFPNSGENYGITSPFYNGYVADNVYADVLYNDYLPEIVFGRITAQDWSSLNTLIMKDINYERNPTLDYSFYDNPLSACGYQTDRWFQLCAEVISGFWEHSLGKTTTRVYAIYSGTPVVGGAWSTAVNTSTVVNYFAALGYITTTIPAGIDWTGTGADMINAISNGTFVVQHRDHGNETGWGEPDFGIHSINQLTNSPPELPFVFSTNCLTGKYNSTNEVFAERFHRREETGCIGINAASEVSFSFVNDIYVWGMYDYFWSQFDPGYGVSAYHDAKPAWAMVYGKIYLNLSSWYYNSSAKRATYNLFHHHGDPYMRLFTELPSYIAVYHPSALVAGETQFPVLASDGSFIALIVGEEIIGRAEGADTTVNVPISPQSSGSIVKVVVTKQNCYRYIDEIDVVPSSIPHVIFAYIDNVAGSHNNGQINPGCNYDIDIAVANWGSVQANNVFGYLWSNDPNINITLDTIGFGNVGVFDTTVGYSSYHIELSQGLYDSTAVLVNFTCWDANDSSWVSMFDILINSPEIVLGNIEGPLSIMPGDTFYLSPNLINNGSGTAYNLDITCYIDDPYITVLDSNYSFDSLETGSSILVNNAFLITVNSSCPQPNFVEMEVITLSSGGLVFTDTVTFSVGSVFIDNFENGDSNWIYTGPTSWHLTEHNSHSSSHSMYCGQEGTWQYAAPVINSYVMTDTLVITDGSVMTFWHWYDIADNSDKIQIVYSTDGGSNWGLLHPDEGYTGAWNYPPYDSIYTGEHKIWEEQHVPININANAQIGWVFFSNPSGVAEGYYFDDVEIVLGSGFVGVEEEEIGLSTSYYFALHRAYPNPVRGRAVILYSIGSEVPVSLVIYDVSGREVSILVNQIQSAGNYRVEWDGRDNHGRQVSSGTYFYSMTAGSFRSGEKLVVIR